MKVLNKYKDDIEEAIYIGRPSRWGNPFVLGLDGNRDDVIIKYRKWVAAQPALQKAMRDELTGHDLWCYCAPKTCHGDVIVEVCEGRFNG